MSGRVLWFHLSQRSGLLATEDGTELSFRLGDDAPNLSGGDLVEFTRRTNGGGDEAVELRLIGRWVEYLNDQHRPLVNEFHSVVEVLH